MREPFETRYAASLADENVRVGLTNFQKAWRVSRDEAIADLETVSGATFDVLRSQLAAKKLGVRERWDDYLAEFKRNAERAGSVVFEAASIDDAVAAIHRICVDHDAHVMVKGKSMASEEIDLNHRLSHRGITAIETDLGEWLLQLSDDHPSHLVMPIIHRRRHQIAGILESALGRPFDADDIPTMVHTVRSELRQRFLSAGVGLSGANALIASTGSTMLVTNEGNNRLVTSLPPVHIVVAGIEKVVPSSSEAIEQLRLLARSATGQAITTFSTFIAGPRTGQKQYIVLIDNGRRAMAADPSFASVLSCIRCGACANVCPPYSIVGGHAFGHVYTGAIGLVNTGFHHGFEAVVGPQSLCISCGACTTVCPADIPLAEQILEVRSRITSIEQRGFRARRVGLRIFQRRRLVVLGALLVAVATWPLARAGTLRLRFPKRHLGWRRAPQLAIRSARVRLRAKLVSQDEPVADVSLLMQCITDVAAPRIAVSTAKLIESLGHTVDVPRAQHCCGLPALDAGERDIAIAMAKQTIEVFESANRIVTPAASCAIALRHEYPKLLASEPEWRARAEALATRTFDLVTFLSGPDGLRPGDPRVGGDDVTVHRFCQSTNVAGLGDSLDQLISHACGQTVTPLRDAAVCCGFGGSTSIVAPEVSREILGKKLAAVAESGAAILVTDNPGCILHIRGGAAATGQSLSVLHVAEYLAHELNL